MKNGVSVSVVTICFNDEAGLRRTAESVRSQDYLFIEYIIIDGGSGDGTADFLNTLPPSVRWLSEPDEGIADAFNKGLRMATGDLVVFMNAGDTFFSTDTLSRVSVAIPAGTEVRKSVVYGNFCTINDNEQRQLSTDHTDMMKSNRINHQSALVGREVCNRFTYDTRLFLGMDYDYWLRCLRAGVPFVKVDVVIARFALDGRSSSLDFRLHNELIRFFLRTINKGRVLNASGFRSLVLLGLVTCWSVALRRAVPSKWRSAYRRARARLMLSRGAHLR